MEGPAPPARMAPGMTYDPSSQQVVLFGGGDNAGGYRNDTWEFHNGTWKNLSLTMAPTQRWAPKMCFDPATGSVLLFGGEANGVETNDTWVLDGSQWKHVHPATSPPLRSYPGMVYDNASGTMLLVGGENITTLTMLNDTWGWVFPHVSLNLSAPTLDLGQTLNLSATVRGPSSGLTFDWSGTSTSMVCSPLFGPNASCTPDEAGVWWLNVSVNDSDNAWANLSDPYQVFSDPQVSPIVSTSAGGEIGQYAEFSTNVSGGTGVYVLVNWSGMPATPCLQVRVSAGTYAVTCSLPQVGVFPVRVSVLDSNYYSSAPTPVLFYRVVQDAQVSSPVPTISAADAGQTVEFSTAASLGSLNYTRYVWLGLGLGPCTGAATATVACHATTRGNYSISVRVNDSYGFESVASSPLPFVVYPAITVGQVQASPERLDVGQSTYLSAAVNGGSPNIVIKWEGLPAGCASSNAASIVCVPSSAGQYLVSLNVTDTPGLSESGASITLSVSPLVAIDRFVLTPSDVAVGGNLNLTVLTSGGTAPYSFVYTGLPGGCLSQNTDAFVCQPRAEGKFVVTVGVTDGVGQTTHTNAVLTVSPPSNSTGGGGTGLSPLIGAGIAATVVGAAVAVAAIVLVIRKRKMTPGQPEDPLTVKPRVAVQC